MTQFNTNMPKPNFNINKLPSAELQEKKPLKDMKTNKDATQIFKSNMTEVRKGPVDVPAGKKIAKKMNEDSQKTGIRFNKKELQKELSGGACTAVTLTFIEKFFHGMDELGKQNKEITTDDVIEVISGFASDNIGHNENDQHPDPKLAIRTLQAALNTIEVSDREGIDSKTKKIQSLVASKGLNVTSRSTSYHLPNMEKKGDFEAEIRNLPEGVYLLRGIVPHDNAKLERYGHSTVFIHREDCAFFFDPNQGVCFIPKEAEVEELKKQMFTQYQDFDLSLFRFYKLEVKNDLSSENLSSDKLLLLMNYKQYVSRDSVKGYSDEQVNVLLNKNIKNLVKNNTTNIVNDISQIGRETFKKIEASAALKILCTEINDLPFDDILKIASLTSDQQEILLEPTIINLIQSKEISVDRFIEIHQQAVGVAGEDVQLQKSLCSLILKNIADITDIHKLNENTGFNNQQKELLKNVQLVTALVEQKITFYDFINFNDKTLSFLIDGSASNNMMFKNIGTLLENGILTVDQLNEMDSDRLSILTETVFVDLLPEAGKEALEQDDILKIASLTNDQLRILLGIPIESNFSLEEPPQISDMIESKEISLDRFLEVYEQVKAIATDDVPLQQALCMLVLNNITEVTDIPNTGLRSKQKEFLMTDRLFGFLMDQDYSFSDFLKLSDHSLSNDIMQYK